MKSLLSYLIVICAVMAGGVISQEIYANTPNGIAKTQAAAELDSLRESHKLLLKMAEKWEVQNGEKGDIPFPYLIALCLSCVCVVLSVCAVWITYRQARRYPEYYPERPQAERPGQLISGGQAVRLPYKSKAYLTERS